MHSCSELRPTPPHHDIVLRRELSAPHRRVPRVLLKANYQYLRAYSNCYLMFPMCAWSDDLSKCISHSRYSVRCYYSILDHTSNYRFIYYTSFCSCLKYGPAGSWKVSVYDMLLLNYCAIVLLHMLFLYAFYFFCKWEASIATGTTERPPLPPYLPMLYK